MKLVLIVIAAVALDLAFGDPRRMPHPVRGIGAVAAFAERVTRRAINNEYIAGAVSAAAVLAVTGGVAAAVVYGAARVHPVAGDVVSVIIIYTSLAARDLAAHAMAVYRALSAGDMEKARRSVAMMVGRDTEGLDEAGVSRAAVESVAENTSDGVTAPLFYAALAGPVGAMLYKAVNTLDSTFGYKNDRYLKFGCVSAKLDDAVNYVPARLTAALSPVAAAIAGMDAKRSFAALRRDGRKHPSPNSGLCEAAVAGALGVRLGGLSYYSGVPSRKPEIGDAVNEITRDHIRGAVALMFLTHLLCLAVCCGARVAVLKLIQGL